MTTEETPDTGTPTPDVFRCLCGWTGTTLASTDIETGENVPCCPECGAFSGGPWKPLPQPTADVEALIERLEKESADMLSLPAGWESTGLACGEAADTLRTLSAEVAALRESHAAAIEQARREERDRILAELRHAIDNDPIGGQKRWAFKIAADRIEANWREGR